MTLIYGMRAAGYWTDERGTNRLDSGAPWYNVYETRDGKYVAIGANETRFYRNAVKLLGLDESQLPDQHDRAGWPEMKRQFAAAFRARTRDEWAALAKGTETCITPVLSMGEAPHHAHLERRNTFVEWTAWCSRRRRHASAAHRAPSSARLRNRASTPMKCWASGGFPRRN